MTSRPFSFAAPLLSLLIAIAIGVRVSLYSRPCVNDPAVLIEVQQQSFPFSERIEVEPCRVFSESYEEARSLFRREAESLGGLTLDSLVVVEGDPDYTLDVTVIPGSEPGLVVHSSGVHGVEGYAGSAIQVAFLQHLNKKKQQNLDVGRETVTSSSQTWKPLLGLPTVILVHAVNPFGMARYRRCNENNVDLNRNALDDEELKILSTSHSNNEKYKKFSSLFNPDKVPSWWDSWLAFWVQAAYYTVKEGYFNLKSALVGGQYYHKKGLFYGGGGGGGGDTSSTTEKSIRLLESWMESYFMSLNSNNATTSKNKETSPPVVTWIDVHTGLGPMGVDTLLQSGNSVLSHPNSRDEELVKWFSKQGVVGSTATPPPPVAAQKSFETDVAKGYEESKGFVIDYYSKKLFLLFRDHFRPFLVVQEFGTVPGVLVAHALVHENAAYFSPELSKEQKLDWAKRTLGRAFYPQSPDWRKAVLDRGIRVLYQAMARSSSLSLHQQQPST